MSSNKIILGLLIVILLLGGILGIRVFTSNNQSEQTVKSENITDNSNSTNRAVSIDDVSQNDANMLVKEAQDATNNIKNIQQNLEKSNTELNSDSLAKREEEEAANYAKYIQKAKKSIGKSSMNRSIILAGCIVLFYIVAFNIIFLKLGVPRIVLIVNIALFVAEILSVVLGINVILIKILGILYFISVVIIEVFGFKILEIPPWLIALVLIPYVGGFIGAILTIWFTWRLGEYFGKGTGFKLGMILLAPIFIPILAFSRER